MHTRDDDGDPASPADGLAGRRRGVRPRARGRRRRAGDRTGARASAEPVRNATIVIEEGGARTGFATPEVTVGGGGTVTVVNLDSMDHTVTSVARAADGTPLFDVRVAAGTSATVPGVEALSAGAWAFFCKFHPNMRGVINVEGVAGGVEPVDTRFEQPLVVPQHAPRRRHQAGHAPRGGADPPPRAAHVDVDLRRQLSRPHHPAAGRARHRGDRRQPAPPRCRVHVDAPARRPPRLGGRRPADDAPDRARRRADLRLPADGRRPPRARLVLLVPRPPDGPHRPQQLARPAGHVHRHRPAQARAAPADGAPRRAADGLGAVLHQRQPADRPVRRRPGDGGPPRRHVVDGCQRAAGRRDGRRQGPRQRPLRAVPRRVGDPLPPAAAELLAVLELQLHAVRRPAVPADRHRQRPAPQGRRAVRACCSGRPSAPT